ncbi:translation elongation factor Ts [Compostibacter hankyongensis]|uniref:Elongation factor Ts n=2 Tax=Compostibacter hankyongensis TaxID=1007089 RepID=A0ABP8G5Y3_9BACT
MMDCRKALVENDGDFEKAIDFLRKKGQKVAALRSDRETKEGVVIAKTADDHTAGVIICLSCETDFVAKNQDFIAFGQSVADLALSVKADSLEALSAASLDGATVADKLNDQVARIGEKITLSRFERVEAGYVTAYIHGNYRIGVLAGFTKAVDAEAAKDITMQIAAMNPVATHADAVAPEVVEREKAIVLEQIKNDPKMAGKPDAMLDKIAEGKLNAFFKENTLLAQAFVKDSSKSVADYLKSVDAEASITEFRRVAIG